MLCNGGNIIFWWIIIIDSCVMFFFLIFLRKSKFNRLKRIRISSQIFHWIVLKHILINYKLILLKYKCKVKAKKVLIYFWSPNKSSYCNLIKIWQVFHHIYSILLKHTCLNMIKYPKTENSQSNVEERFHFLSFFFFLTNIAVTND